ncbi:hypothetical protein BGW80DRAFT_861109 [Lactifluus volemus]|nr:hypothetical protein BGW80DRAFT_861109 [Lactifluus volemus]
MFNLPLDCNFPWQKANNSILSLSHIFRFLSEPSTKESAQKARRSLTSQLKNWLTARYPQEIRKRGKRCEMSPSLRRTISDAQEEEDTDENTLMPKGLFPGRSLNVQTFAEHLSFSVLIVVVSRHPAPPSFAPGIAGILQFPTQHQPPFIPSS